MEVTRESEFVYELNKFESEEYDNWSDSESKSSDSLDSRQRFNETDDAKTILSISSGESESILSDETKNVESVLDPDLKESILRDVQEKFSNLHQFYPVPEDSGLSSAFWTLYPSPPVYKPDGVELFFDLVKSLNLVPISCLRQQLKSDTIDLKHYCIDPKIIQPLTEALLKNPTVKALNLQENCLTASACYYLSKLLLRNTVLNTLNLTDCKIGVTGAMKLNEGLTYSTSLRNLNLSGCELGNKGFYYIVDALSTNILLRYLNISNNKLDEGSANHLQKLFTLNESIVCVNVSWNSFHNKVSSEAIYKGLAENTTITDIDLSWNSIGKDSFPYISYLVANSKYIKRLNLAANRLTNVEGFKIANALLSNKCLEELQLSKNPLGSQGVSEFINVLSSNAFIDCQLLFLNFEDMWATKDSLPTLISLKETKPNLNIQIGGILGDYKIIGPNLKELFFKTANYEAMSCKKKKDRKNFGIFILSLQDSVISKEQFANILKNSKIKISEGLAEEIMNQFLVTKNTIDQLALKETYKLLFPNVKLPEKPPSLTNPDEMGTKTKKRKKKSKRRKGRKGKGKRGAKKGKKRRKLRGKKKTSKKKGGRKVEKNENDVDDLLSSLIM